MLVTREERSGYITCARDRVQFGDCPGYTSEPVDLVVETVVKTFGDQHGDMSDPYARIESVSHESLHTVDGDPPTCRHCGSPASLSLEPRPQYARLSESGPNALVERAERERAQAVREHEALSAQERSAAALERLAAQPGETEQLRAALARRDEQIDRLLARIEQNGHGEPEPQSPSDVTPRPRKRTSA